MFGRDKGNVPEWASVLGDKEYSAFISEVRNYFEQNGEPYVLEDGMVTLEKDGWQFGLVNLAQMCAQIKVREYAEFIRHHFGILQENKAFEEGLAFDDFERMKEYIGVRVYNKEFIDALGSREGVVICRPLAGEVYATLVFDFPRSVRNISPQHAEKWGRPEDELFAVGIENIRCNYKLEAVSVNIGEDDVLVIEEEHFFVSNIMFEIEQHKELVGRGGAIVGIPTRSLAVVYPICDASVVRVLSALFNIIPATFERGPGSLTREIYWYHDKEYMPLPYEPGEKTKFVPPEEFLSLLNTLS